MAYHLLLYKKHIINVYYALYLYCGAKSSHQLDITIESDTVFAIHCLHTHASRTHSEHREAEDEAEIKLGDWGQLVCARER